MMLPLCIFVERRFVETCILFLAIIVKQKTTVAELKVNIQRTLGRKIKEDSGQSCLSWYVIIYMSTPFLSFPPLLLAVSFETGTLGLLL